MTIKSTNGVMYMKCLRPECGRKQKKGRMIFAVKGRQEIVCPRCGCQYAVRIK